MKGAFDGCGVQRFPVESCVGRRAGGGNDRRRRRCACAAAEPGATQCAALVLPERLHGALLVGADRRRAGAQLPEAAHASAFGRMPERGERDQSGSTGCRRCACSGTSARGRSSGPAACDTSGARRTAGCRRAQAEPGATPGGGQGDRPGLPRRLPRALRGHCAGRLGIDRVPQAQRQDIVARMPAGARERPRRCGRACRRACACASCRARRTAAADGAGAAAGDAARGTIHSPKRLWRRLCRVLRRPASRSRPHRGLPALQQEQPVAALPAGADRAARRSVGLGR